MSSVRDRLAKKLRLLGIFANCDEATLQGIAERSQWLSVPGGRLLIEQGEQAEAVFVLLSGRLAVITGFGTSEERLVTEISAGDSVGELGVIASTRRSASVLALRDSELLRIPGDVLKPLIASDPAAFDGLLQTLAQRLLRLTRGKPVQRMVRNLALLPLDDASSWPDIAMRLQRSAQTIGLKCHIFTEADGSRDSNQFAEMEENFDLCLYLATKADDTWRRLCKRQADRLLLLASGTDKGRSARPPDNRLIGDRRPVDMAICEAADLELPTPSRNWPVALAAARWVHRLRENNDQDYSRLVRLMKNQGQCLVLSGGGARGFAHVGVQRALQEAGRSLDLLGGSSMGAIVAAGIALEWDSNDLESRLAKVFVEGRPTSDLTFPIVALLRGRRVSHYLKSHFADLEMQDLWRPCYSVATDLRSGEPIMQTKGSLWRNLRASVAIPGLLPPVPTEQHLLADGGVVDNLPVGFLLDPPQGHIIAVDVAQDAALRCDFLAEELEAPFWRLWPRVRRGRLPGIFDILLRAGTINSSRQRKEVLEKVDLWLAPPLEEIGVLQWGAFHRAVEIGHRYACQQLEICDREQTE
ncbi:patatin-like phospholipase family protein [Limibacillus sp. MBR-115]|jgi:NTE family protein|uniref:patatin-like phospholipase family protein n=1 Tax=Limibacillus sp. MBR-115 TaxID=3156465 RepID=UPI00339B0651